MLRSLKKIAKAVLAVFALLALPIVVLISVLILLLAPVHFIGRVNRPKAVRLLFLAIRILQQINRLNPKSKSSSSLDDLMVSALLGKGVAWYQVQPIIQRSNADGNFRDLSSAAFYFYIVEERYEDAHHAADQWRRNIRKELDERKEEMQRFFREQGTDSINQRLTRLKEWRRSMDEWEADPQGRPQPQLEMENLSTAEIMRTIPFMSYYSAHLALEIMRWMQTLDREKMEHAKAAIQAKRTPSFPAWMPSFVVDEGFVRSLGMDEVTLSEIRQRIIGRQAHESDLT